VRDLYGDQLDHSMVVSRYRGGCCNTYLELHCILNIPFEQDNTTYPVLVDQSLDLWTWYNTMEADRKKLTTIVSSV
jgi:hypothetical protein